LKKIDAEKIYKEVNRVLPNCIRIEADECSYNLHIILRYKMEKDFDRRQNFRFGVTPLLEYTLQFFIWISSPDEVHGCLQDIHWAHGSLVLSKLCTWKLLAHKLQKDEIRIR
jgi:carboxypeptidase Taq